MEKKVTVQVPVENVYPPANKSFRQVNLDGDNKTVKQMKEELQDKTGTPAQIQLLFLNDNSTLLMDETAELESLFGLLGKSLLELTLYTKSIEPTRVDSVSPLVRVWCEDLVLFDYGSHFHAKVTSNDTVLQLKQKIDQVAGIPPCRQTLVFDALPRMEVMDDWKLEDFLLNYEANIFHLHGERRNRSNSSPVNVVVKLTNEPNMIMALTFRVELDRDTVNTLIAEIRRLKVFVKATPFMLQNDIGIRFHDGNSTLSQYRVKANDTIIARYR